MPRRSRRTLKIPDDAVPTHGSQPPGAARPVSGAPPRLASDPPPRAPAATTPWDAVRSSPATAMADDVIRPMRIISIGEDPTPMPSRAEAMGWPSPAPAPARASAPPAGGDGAPSHPGPAAGLAALALSLGMPGDARGRAQLRDRSSGQPARPSDAPPARDPAPREARDTAHLDEISDRTIVDLADVDDGFSDAITAERDVFVPAEARAAFDEASRGASERAHARADRLPPVAMPAARESEESFEEIEPEADSTPSTDLAPAPASAAPSSAAPSSATPKKPPPVPPKRALTPSPNESAAIIAGAKAEVAATAELGAPDPAKVDTKPAPDGEAPPQATPPRDPLVEPITRKRQKPWWEELFGEDFSRTMDRLEPKSIARDVDFVEESLGVEKGAVILDLCCGTGAHAVELASRGYSVVGYDLSLAMLARAADEAQDRNQKLNFLQGDMREMAFEEMFDGVYCWATSFGYFDDEKNLSVLQRAYRALRQGGMLLLDVANRDYVSPRSPSLVWFEGDGCVCMDEMHVDFFASRLRVKRTAMFEDGRSRELDYSIRLYSLHELGKMLHEVGFKVVEVTGHPAHPGVYFGAESPRIIILAERS
jgi:ubiquinone/menaquinone biosynthesis C-methylase UbiE